MTDPMRNTQTGHGSECLCSECMKAFSHSLRIDGLLQRPIVHEPRVFTRVMNDGVKTKDGMS